MGELVVRQGIVKFRIEMSTQEDPHVHPSTLVSPDYLYCGNTKQVFLGLSWENVLDFFDSCRNPIYVVRSPSYKLKG